MDFTPGYATAKQEKTVWKWLTTRSDQLYKTMAVELKEHNKARYDEFGGNQKDVIEAIIEAHRALDECMKYDVIGSMITRLGMAIAKNEKGDFFIPKSAVKEMLMLMGWDRVAVPIIKKVKKIDPEKAQAVRQSMNLDYLMAKLNGIDLTPSTSASTGVAGAVVEADDLDVM